MFIFQLEKTFFLFGLFSQIWPGLAGAAVTSWAAALLGTDAYVWTV